VHRRSRERRLVAAVVVSFILTTLCFVTSRAITEIVSRRIEREAESIGNNALVATKALATARNNLRKVVSEMNALRLSDQPKVVEERLREIDVSRRETAVFWAKYVSIPFYPGERVLAARVEPDIASAGRAVDDVIERVRRGDRKGGLQVIDARALPAIDQADQGLGRLLRLNGQEARASAARILASKRPWGFLPEILGAFFAIAASVFGVRLLTQYLSWAAERSAELEGFAGRVAHDIRSPLGSASLALEIAQRGQDIDSKTRELLARASRTMVRIARLVDGLLVFATSGGYIVPGVYGEQKTNVADALGGVVEDLKFEAETKHIEIDYEAPDPALAVMCSAGVFISMVTNLASNAMKFMGESLRRRITIRAHQIEDDVEIDVSDTGPGIAPALRERVFEPYVRGGDSKVPGYGLGLATVRRLAEAHKGAVGVERIPEGGSHFWFRIPLAH
jgi:signal transduction histidine kinase